MKPLEKEQYTIEDLLEIVRILRGENGCPWDKVQTHQTLKKDMIEEAYEAIDALDAGDDKMFANELGDVLLQVAFHSVLGEERKAFDFNTVLNEVCTKLITRHTHVFGEQKAASAEDALGTWAENKKKEKGQKTYTETLQDVPSSLPALLRAEKVQKRAAGAGFDWKTADGAADKIGEETKELLVALEAGNAEQIAEEYGDLLFSVVNLGRFLHVTPELAMTAATNKFIRRFAAMEAEATRQGKDFATLDLQEMDEFWNKIKQKS